MAERFEQDEPLTVRLRGILAEYPPGVSTLKELLQNADDAGAKLITYTLDTRSYPTTTLVDQGLAVHQGPALCVYNDAMFSEKDFISLQNLGNSVKMEDRLATGKFGLGFNAVYGWTDVPSILTGRHFVAFSPHESLIRRGRGVRFDFVKNNAQDITDQLAAFGFTRIAPNEEFHGTIVRLPFRTQEQAEESEISKIAVTPQEILKIFEDYQSDVVESLVFLKNVERIEFYHDATKLGCTNIRNLDSVRKMRASIASAISSSSVASQGIVIDIECNYNSEQRHNLKSLRTYQVQHVVFDMDTYQMSEELRNWATNNKAVAAIALSACIDGSASYDAPSFSRVFVTLPLPIPLENTTVNINSMFALRRDRRSLWTDNDADGSRIMPEIQWNNHLVRKLLPIVWHDLLIKLTKFKSSVYQYLPLMPQSVGSLFNKLASDVLKQLLDGKSVIWQSSTGRYMTLEMGYIAAKGLEAELRQCLYRLGMPIFADIPDTFVNLIQESQYPHTILTPETLRIWLRKNVTSTKACDIPMAMRILEYVSEDERMDQLYGLPIFATRNGSLQSLRINSQRDSVDHFRAKLYIGSLEESSLFDGKGELFLLTEEFPRIVATRIQTHIATISASLNLEIFSLQCFARYARDVLFLHITPAKSNAETINLLSCKVDLAWIQKLWNWLDTRNVKEVEKVVQSLWLIPLADGQSLRKIKGERSEPIFAQAGEGKELISELFQACTDRFPLVERDFQVSKQGYLRSCRQIVDASDLEALITWITPEKLKSIGNQLRDRLREHILLAIRRRGTLLELQEKWKLSQLPIFKELIATETQSGVLYRTKYSSIPGTGAYPLLAVRCVPAVPGAQFFDAATYNDQDLFRFLGYPILSHETLLENFIIQNLEKQDRYLVSSLIEFIFDKVPLTGRPDLVRSLSTVEFVKVCDNAGHASERKLKPSDVVDSSSALACLYFDDEKVFGSDAYSPNGQYYQALKILGMKRDFDMQIANDRIRVFHDRSAKNQDGLYEKCCHLLKHLNSSKALFDFKNEWLPLIKIPAVKVGRAVVLHPSECRLKSMAPLVDQVLGVVDVHVEQFLAKKFGWDSILEPKIISSQISCITSLPSSDVELALYPVLDYLNIIAAGKDKSKIGDFVSEIESKLGSKAWLPGSTKGLWPPNRLFFSDAQGFEPYMSNIPVSWSKKLKPILTLLKVAPRPSAEHLLGFLASAKTNEPLSEAHMNATITALQRLESDFNPSYLPKLLIPDVHGKLMSVNEFVPKIPKGASTVYYAHSRVSSSLAFNCGIPQNPGDLAETQHLSGPDFFEEYSQEESIVNRISKTIRESSLWSSLNEFVANAEDCGGATKAHWILDSEKSEFPSKKLLCDEIEEWQTPALYFYNDGVFTESDFQALINVGMGSKSDDTSKIGKYGLGSLSMYLFTDIPSMISGEYFVIFDPTRQYLPFRNGQSRRPGGTRLKLARMKLKFCDQLAPFVGIGGYTLGMNKFQGTIFRFPIRSKKQYDRSSFASQSHIRGYDILRNYLDVHYYDQARRSLIMLRRVNDIQYARRLFKYRVAGNVMNQSSDVMWTVASRVEPSTLYTEKDDSSQFKKVESRVLIVTVTKMAVNPKTEKWMIVDAFMGTVSLSVPKSLKKFVTEERLIATGDSDTRSVPDVAVAANITNSKDGCLFYNSLPFEANCGLPVNFHSRFAMSPDRRSLRTDSKDGEWNTFLAKTCLPILYFIFSERLISTHHDIDVYAFWPSKSIRTENEISSVLQSAFWDQLPRCTRKVSLTPTKSPVPISQAIFDTRHDRPNRDSVRSLVMAARPSYAIVNSPIVLSNLFPVNQGSTGKKPDLVCLTPEYTRGLLRDASVEEILQTFADIDLKYILLFILGKRSNIEILIGCNILRLANGKFAKVAENVTLCGLGRAKPLYIVDEQGYKLFKTISPDNIISPVVLDKDVLNKLELRENFNVCHMDGAVIDLFLKPRLGAEIDVKTFNAAESAWLNLLYDHVCARKFTVTCYERHAILPLSNKGGNTFVSMAFWNDPRLLPPVNDLNQRQIIDQFPSLHILANLNLVDMRRRVTVDSAQRFLGYLYSLTQEDFRAVEKMFRDKGLITDSNIETLKSWLFERTGTLPSAERTVLAHLPIWKVWNPTKLKSVSSTSRALSTAAAVDVLIVPKTLFMPDFHPEGPYIVDNDDIWLGKLRVLGAKDVNNDEYIADHLVPYITSMPEEEPNRIKLLRRILSLMSSNSNKWLNSPLAKTPLFPNRNGKLCIATNLYDPSESVFTWSFGADRSKFPDTNFDIQDLKKLGLQSSITRANFTACLDSLEREYRAGVSDALCERAENVWKAFSDRCGPGNISWSGPQVAALANYHFVPVRQFKAGESYRHGIPVNGDEHKVLATMNEITLSAYTSIVWTQKFLPKYPPAGWIMERFDFSPTLNQVVNHLVDLATLVSPKCDVAEKEFFEDLKATYQYLSRPGLGQQVSGIIKEHYLNAPVWLNEGSPLEDISPLQKQRFCGLISEKKSTGVTVDSLLWLPANNFVEGIVYDASQYNLHHIKTSVMPYRDLIRLCGLIIVRQTEVRLSPESITLHSDTILQSLQEMRRSKDTCDMTIRIEGRDYHVHLVIMAVFSSFFRNLIATQHMWKDLQMRTLNLDVSQPGEPSTSTSHSGAAKESYATADSVATVIQWVYHGRLNIDDTRIMDNDDAVHARMDDYLDVLQLADVWDIPSLKKHIENRILRNAALFIRIENVREVRDVVKQCNAKEVEEHCQKFENLNNEAVRMISSAV